MWTAGARAGGSRPFGDVSVRSAWWWSAPPADALGARHRGVSRAHGAWSEPTCRTRHLFVSVETAVLPVTVGRAAVRATSGRAFPCGGLAPKVSGGTASTLSPSSVNELPCGVRWLPSRCRCPWISGRSPRPDGAARPARPGRVNSVVYSYRSPCLLSLSVLATSQCARFRQIGATIIERQKTVPRDSKVPDPDAIGRRPVGPSALGICHRGAR